MPAARVSLLLLTASDASRLAPVVGADNAAIVRRCRF
jgi:hypothetical protein